MDRARAGRRVRNKTAGALCQNLVLSGCGRNGSPRGCLGDSDSADGDAWGRWSEGALRHTS